MVSRRINVQYCIIMGLKIFFILKNTKDMRDVLIILEFKLKFYTLSGLVVRCYSAEM